MTMRRAELALAAFVSGSAGLAVELFGARLMSASFGTSLRVWSVIVGITMGSLALGYWLGGLVADRRPTRRLAMALLLLSAVAVVLSPWLGEVARLLEKTPAVVGCMIAAMLILGPALLPLGMVSTVLIRVGSAGTEESGRISGLVYALTTAGGVAGSLACGFWAIPFLGVRTGALVFGCLLAISALPLASRDLRGASP